MQVFAKPSIDPRRGDDERAQLIAVFDACIACEMASMLAGDALSRRGTSPAGLVACAEVFGEAAAQLSRLTVPDAASVIDELNACRAACALAREACASSEDPVAERCRIECQRCAEACDQAVWSLLLAA